MDEHEIHIHEEEADEYIAEAGAHLEQQWHGQSSGHENAMQAEEKDETQGREITIQSGSDEPLQAGGQRTEIQYPAGSAVAGPQRNDGHQQHHAAIVQRQVLLPATMMLRNDDICTIAHIDEPDYHCQNTADVIFLLLLLCSHAGPQCENRDNRGDNNRAPM